MTSWNTVIRLPMLDREDLPMILGSVLRILGCPLTLVPSLLDQDQEQKQGQKQNQNQKLQRSQVHRAAVSLRDPASDRYLRHRQGILCLSREEDSDLFRHDASFHVAVSPAGFGFLCSNQGFEELGIAVSATTAVIAGRGSLTFFSLFRLPPLGGKGIYNGELFRILGSGRGIPSGVRLKSAATGKWLSLRDSRWTCQDFHLAPAREGWLLLPARRKPLLSWFRKEARHVRLTGGNGPEAAAAGILQIREFGLLSPAVFLGHLRGAHASWGSKVSGSSVTGDAAASITIAAAAPVSVHDGICPGTGMGAAALHGAGCPQHRDSRAGGVYHGSRDGTCWSTQMPEFPAQPDLTGSHGSWRSPAPGDSAYPDMCNLCPARDIWTALWRQSLGDPSVPLVSVIIPVWNSWHYLDECLWSLEAQILRETEIICVDDGSDDGSLAILERHARRDPRIRILKQEHAGAAAARNRGLREARGRYLSFLDSDDVFDSRLLLDLTAAALGRDLDIAVCRSRGLRGREVTALDWTIRPEHLPRGTCFSSRECSGRIFQAFNGWAWDKLFRRDFVTANRLEFQDCPVSNDARFVFGALCLAERIGLVPGELVLHRYRTGSIESSRGDDPLAFMAALEGIRSLLTERGLMEDFGRSFLNWEVSFCRWQLETCPLPAEVKEGTTETETGIGPGTYMDPAPGTRSRTDTGRDPGSCTGAVPDQWPSPDTASAPEPCPGTASNPEPCPGGLPRPGSRSEFRKFLGEFLEQEDAFDSSCPLADPRDILWLYDSGMGSSMNPAPAVSVIIPCYNAAKFINAALESVRNQSLTSFEILAVDDGSADGTADVIARAAAADPRIRLIRQENAGAGAARNRGLREARGHFVTFLDSDDLYERDFLRSMLIRLRSTGADMATCRYVRFYDDTGITEYPLSDVRTDLLPPEDPFDRDAVRDRFFQLFIPVVWNRMFRRQFLEEQQIRFQELANSNDTGFVYAAMLKARMTVLDETLVRYRIRKNSLVRSRDKAPLCFIEALKETRRRLEQEGLLNDPMMAESFRKRIQSNAEWNKSQLTPANQCLVTERLAAEVLLEQPDSGKDASG